MKYTIPEDFKEIVGLINPDSFIADMFEVGEIQNISGDYSRDCKLLCNNSTAWILKKLTDSKYLYEIQIVEGHFDTWEHTWIKAGDYYLDLTLAQFLECPKIVVSRIGEVKGYIEEKTFTPFEWAKKTREE